MSSPLLSNNDHDHVSTDLPSSPTSATNAYVSLLEEGDEMIDLTEDAGKSWFVKYKASYIVLLIISLGDTIEYGVIMPSLFNYLDRLDQDGQGEYVHDDNTRNHYYGLILSSFSFASLIAKPFLGYLADHRPYLETLVWSQLVAVGGNLLYFLTEYIVKHQHSGNPFMWLIGSRILCGIGCANSALTFSYVARTCPSDERTKYMTIFSMSKVAGFLLGPGLNAITAAMNFKIGNFQVDDLNSPGLFIAFVQVGMIVLLGFFLLEPPPYEKEEEEEEISEDKTSSFSNMISFCNLPILICFINITFFNFFIGCLEAFVVPVTKVVWGWSSLQNSYVYLIITFVSLFTSISVMRLSKVVEDRTFLVFACSISALTTSYIHFAFWYDMTYSIFWTGIIFWAVPISLAFPTNRALFSRLVEKSHLQGFLSSNLSVFASLGGLLGPLWVGATLSAGSSVPSKPVHERIAPVAILGCVVMAFVILALNILALFIIPTNAAVLAHGNPITTEEEDEDSLQTPLRNGQDEEEDMRIVTA